MADHQQGVISLPDSSDDELDALLRGLAVTAAAHRRCSSGDIHCAQRRSALECIDAVLEEQTTRRAAATQP
ncbi:hypothetical protein [Knoellia sp. LjRoot47]|uniref:hypothetical protein n=1 Tax=Knoellia sp. LjRoot47 TaxID=3342330 RepID=UPI003ECE256D